MPVLPMISRFGLLCAFAFVALSFIGRFLLPFGDEPDFEVRSFGMLRDDHPWWSPYSVFHSVLSPINLMGTCDIVSSPLSLWAHIPQNCGEDLEQILTRFALTFLLMLPLLLPIIFRRAFIALIDPKLQRLGEGEWSLRLDAVALTILLPSVVSAVGVLAEEQYVIIMSLVLVLVVANPILTAGLLFIIFSLDLGNGIVVLTAVVFLHLNRIIGRKLGFRVLVVVIFMQLAVVFAAGFMLIDVLSSVSFMADKVSSVILAFTDDYSSVNKYPVVLRPVITFMTAIFMSPSGLKVIPLYLMFATFIWIGIRRFKQLRYTTGISKYGLVQNNGHEAFDRCRVLFITALHVVLFFVFLLPTYSNAKYYLFLFPLFLVGALQVFTPNQIRATFIFSNILAFVFLALYRMG